MNKTFAVFSVCLSFAVLLEAEGRGDASEPEQIDSNQLLNLPPAPAGGRFTRPTDLVWPANVGEADICLWADDKIAACSVTIDDNCKPDHNWWFAIAKEYGIRLTWFVITGRVGESNAGSDGTWADWQKVVDAGHSVQSHSSNHNSEAYHREDLGETDYTLTEEQLTTMYKGSLDTINANLTNNFACTIAYPRGEAHTNVASRYAIACRGTAGRPSVANKINYLETDIGGGDPYFVDMIVSGATTNTTLDWVVSKTTWKRGWLIPLSHAVNAYNPTNDKLVEWERNIRYMGAHKDYLWFGSFDDVAKYGQERDSATLTVTENTATRIGFALTDTMRDSIFTFPLTVKVHVPDAWEYVAATQDVHGVAARLVVHEGAKYALVKAVPDCGAVALYPSDVEVVLEEPQPVDPTPTDPTPSDPEPTDPEPERPVPSDVQDDETATTITDAAGFQAMAENPSGKYRLANDIALGASYSAIPEFSGVLYGRGFAVSGQSSNLIQRLTGRVCDLVIENVSHVTVAVNKIQPSTAGVAVELAGGTVCGCVISDCTFGGLSSVASSFGAIAAKVTGSGNVVSNCYVASCKIGKIEPPSAGVTTFIAGGLVGAVGDSAALEIVGCKVQNADVEGGNAGGIVGAKSTQSTVRLVACETSGSVNGSFASGGMLGYASGENTETATAEFHSCTNRATVETAGTSGTGAGGILGRSYKGGSCFFRGCVNEGEVSTAGAKPTKNAYGYGAGGIIGGAWQYGLASWVRMDRCINRAAVAATNLYAGGLAGDLNQRGTASFSSVSNSANYGAIRGGSSTGGLIGRLASTAAGDICVNAANHGAVTATVSTSIGVGGLVGEMTSVPENLGLRAVCQTGVVKSESSRTSQLIGSFSGTGKTTLALASVIAGGTVQTVSGQTGLVTGGSNSLGTKVLTVTVDSNSRFSEDVTGTAYYGFDGTAKTQSDLVALGSKSLTDRSAQRLLNAYSKPNGLPRWVQGKGFPELSLFSSGIRGLLVLFR